MSDNKQLYEQRKIIPPRTAFISEEICSLCEIGLSNLISFNKDIKEKLKTLETYCADLHEYQSLHGSWMYDIRKYWWRCYRDLRKIKDFIDQGKAIEDVKIFYNEVFHK